MKAYTDEQGTWAEAYRAARAGGESYRDSLAIAALAALTDVTVTEGGTVAYEQSDPEAVEALFRDGFLEQHNPPHGATTVAIYKLIQS